MADDSGNGAPVVDTTVEGLSALLHESMTVTADTAVNRGEIVPYNRIAIEHVDWVVPGLIPEGMLSVVAGEQGLGKSLLHAAWASHLSRSDHATILVSAEDSPSHTTKARLMAANADEGRVYHAAILPVLGNGDDPRWLVRIEDWITETGAHLLVLDPISAFMHANSDTYKEQHVRLVLASLDHIAQETSCAIVYVMHLTKGMGANPLQRIAGSGAFTQAARSVVLMTPETTRNELGRYVAHVKCNIAEEAPTQRWEVRPIMIPNVNGRDVRTARLEYMGTVDVDKFELLSSHHGEESDGGKLDYACDLIGQWLEFKDMRSKELMADLAEHGISERTAERARTQLGVEKEKRGAVWWVMLRHSTPPKSSPPNHLGGVDLPHNDAGLVGRKQSTPPRGGDGGVGGDHLGTVHKEIDHGTASLDELHDFYKDP